MFAPSEIRIDKAGQEPFSPRAYEEREKNIPSRIRRNVKKKPFPRMRRNVKKTPSRAYAQVSVKSSSILLKLENGVALFEHVFHKNMEKA